MHTLLLLLLLHPPSLYAKQANVILSLQHHVFCRFRQWSLSPLAYDCTLLFTSLHLPWTHFIHDVHWSELAAKPLLQYHMAMHQSLTLLLYHIHRPSASKCVPSIHFQSSDQQTRSPLHQLSHVTFLVLAIRMRSYAYSNSQGSPLLTSSVTTSITTGNGK